MKPNAFTGTSLAGALLLVSGTASATRNDILGGFTEDSDLTFQIGPNPAPARIIRGTVSLRTDLPFCLPTSGTPCSYVLNNIFM
jgi:hypothetical protein